MRALDRPICPTPGGFIDPQGPCDIASLRSLIADASARLDAADARPRERSEFASPACLAHEMSGAYMGFASPCESIAALNEALESTRSCMRLSLRIADAAIDPGSKMLAASIYRDEVRCCGVLTSAILALRGAPSRRSCALDVQALAAAGSPEGLALLNSALQSLVCKLTAAAPGIRDEAIAANVSVVRIFHEEMAGVVDLHLHRPAFDRKGLRHDAED
jgi:hypothetical protein